jgi:HK97 family phage prohead protease
VVARNNGDTRAFAISLLAGLIEDGDVPRDMTYAPEPGDETDLMDACKALGLDDAGYSALLRQAYELTASPRYQRLHAALSHALEQHDTLDEKGLQLIKAITEETSMEHKAFETTDVITLGEGEMLAYASTFGNVDHVGDVVMPGAFAEDVARIKSGAVKVPLIWGHDHRGSPQNFVGVILDANETDDGLEVHARFDLDDPAGLKAWKLVKDGRIDRLSIRYTVPKGGVRRSKGGANELHKIDLREVSLTLTPANDQARVLAVKSHDDWPFMDPRLVEGYGKPYEDLDAKAKRVARELEPVKVKTFEC